MNFAGDFCSSICMLYYFFSVYASQPFCTWFCAWQKV